MFKNRIRWIDIKSIVAFGLAYPIANMAKNKCKNLWLFSERPAEARDNGYWLYKYVKEHQPQQYAYYVIARCSKDRKHIENFGNIVNFGSFKHYVIYLAATHHISAQVDADSPNSRVSNFLETHGLLKNKRVFLQHGITKDKISFGYYSCSRADLFVCAAKPEYEFCNKEFGYPEGAVKLLGFARFDGLNVFAPKKQILVMPTWRAWLAGVDENEFSKSEYYIKWQDFLSNDRLNDLLLENNIQLIFYPHSDMQKFVDLFENQSSNISIASAKDHDVQLLLNESSMLITDYSSVAFDMAYMRRPLCYYHFDYEEYRSGQHPEGYFSYENDGFGPVCKTVDEIISFVKSSVENDQAVDPVYQDRVADFFGFDDRNNCKRIYDMIKEI